MYPGPGQIGCAYTGSTGGPTRTETPIAICAFDTAGIAMTMAVNRISPSNLTIRILVTFLVRRLPA